MNNGYFYSTHGNKSSSRLIGALIILYAMIMGFLVLYWGKEAGESILALSTAVGLIFGTIAGSAMVFIFQQKRTEVKQDNSK